MQRKLNDTAVRSAKPADGKPRKITDGGGLYLYVTNTSKSWRYNYRYQQKQKTLTFGLYPEISLSNAREMHDNARSRLARGMDPSKKEITGKGAKFRDTAEEWLAMIEGDWSVTHRTRSRHLLDQYILPWIGDDPIAALEPPDILEVLKKMERQGKLSSMYKAKVICGQVLRYGVAKGDCTRDSTADLKGALKSEQPVHFAAITDPKQITTLMDNIDDYSGGFLTREGLKLMAHLFVRPGELRKATRDEFDLEKRVWSIPGSRMKNKKPHSVPLSNQVMVIVGGIIETYSGSFLLPATYTSLRPMSENTLNMALRRMGYDNTQMTSHGFRAMASTQLNEMGWNPDAIEAQLSHVEGNAVRAAYNRGLYWDERVKVMQSWSDYLAP